MLQKRPHDRLRVRELMKYPYLGDVGWNLPKMASPFVLPRRAEHKDLVEASQEPTPDIAPLEISDEVDFDNHDRYNYDFYINGQ